MQASYANILGGLVSNPSQLQRTVTRITEFLATELAQPRTTAPPWSDTDWLVAKAVVAMHGVGPLLSGKLLWAGPAHWNRFLDEQRDHTQRRHRRILQTVAGLDEGLRRDGIAATALKGVALHSMGIYRGGERPMADVDLLVRPVDAERTARLLESLGFYESSRSWKEREFCPVNKRAVAPLGEHADNGVKLELHERICEILPTRATDISAQIFPLVPQPGFNPYPSAGALLFHLVFHAAGAMAYQSARLLHLHDLAMLCNRMQDADWDAFLAPRASGISLWWAWPPLRLMARYFSAAIPARVVDALMRDCPWVLAQSTRRQSLTDVSYSHVWVDAFPGIAWSQSLGEALEYFVRRIRPSAEHLAWREKAAPTQAWIASSEWAASSQFRRIVRWVTSRQMRPPAEHSLRAVLGRPK